MALRAARMMMVNRMGAPRAMATSTTPKMKPHAPTLNETIDLGRTKPKTVEGEYVPVYVAMGMIFVAFSFVSVTAKQHLVYSPAVHVSKKRRESFPEFSDPAYAADGSDKFIKRSFFRKVAHLSL